MPESFKEILLSLANANAVCNCDLVETKAPVKSAPYAIALEGHISDRASGRFCVLYNPAKKEVWGSSIRIITFIETDNIIDTEQNGEYATKMWKYYQNELEKVAGFRISANITASSEFYFGDGISETKSDLVGEKQNSFEMRASWSVIATDILPQIKVWDKMMHRACGVNYSAQSTLLN